MPQGTRPTRFAPRPHVVLAIAALLALPSAIEFVEGSVSVERLLIVVLLALVVAWVGAAIVKAAVVAYLPEETLPPLEPIELPAARPTGSEQAGASPEAAPGTEPGQGEPAAEAPGGEPGAASQADARSVGVGGPLEATPRAPDTGPEGTPRATSGSASRAGTVASAESLLASALETRAATQAAGRRALG
jgi:hypothetical protein